MNKLLLLFLLVISLPAQAQNIDSLKQVLHKIPDGGDKAMVNVRIGFAYLTKNTDSACFIL